MLAVTSSLFLNMLGTKGRESALRRTVREDTDCDCGVLGIEGSAVASLLAWGCLSIPSSQWLPKLSAKGSKLGPEAWLLLRTRVLRVRPPSWRPLALASACAEMSWSNWISADVSETMITRLMGPNVLLKIAVMVSASGKESGSCSQRR